MFVRNDLAIAHAPLTAQPGPNADPAEEAGAVLSVRGITKRGVIAMPLSRILSTPVGQIVLTQSIYLIGQHVLTRNSPKDNVADVVIQRLTELQDKIAKSASGTSPSQPVHLTMVVQGPSAESGQRQQGQAQSQEKAQEQPEEKTTVTLPGGYTVRFNGPAPKQDVATACLPCTRAHLLTVAGALKEALRFAREGGVQHPEVQDRLDAAAEEIVVMERFDLAPEKVANAPDHEKEALRELIPKIRTMRQNLINNVKSVEDLEEIAVQAVELYKQVRSDKSSINWEEVEAQQKRQQSVA